MARKKFKIKVPKSTHWYFPIIVKELNSKLIFLSLLEYYLCIFYIKILLMICVTMYSCVIEDIKIPIHK